MNLPFWAQYLHNGGLRTHIGFVMQDVFIFSGRLIDNIALGQDEIGLEAMEKAVKRANAHNFIQRLPNGLYQEIAEGGSTLSAGEMMAQRGVYYKLNRFKDIEKERMGPSKIA